MFSQNRRYVSMFSTVAFHFYKGRVLRRDANQVNARTVKKRFCRNTYLDRGPMVEKGSLTFFSLCTRAAGFCSSRCSSYEEYFAVALQCNRSPNLTCIPTLTISSFEKYVNRKLSVLRLESRIPYATFSPLPSRLLLPIIIACLLNPSYIWSTNNSHPKSKHIPVRCQPIHTSLPQIRRMDSKRGRSVGCRFQFEGWSRKERLVPGILFLPFLS